MVDLPVTSALEYHWHTDSGRFSYFHDIDPFASSFHFNRNTLFPRTDSAGIFHRIRPAALSAASGDGMDLGAPVLDFVCFVRSYATTSRRALRSLFRLGL